MNRAAKALSLIIHCDRFTLNEVLTSRWSGEFARVAIRRKDWDIDGRIIFCPTGATDMPLIVTMMSDGPVTSQLNVDEPNGETIFGTASNLTRMGSDMSGSN